MKLYAVKDTKVGFGVPMSFANDFVAIREFSNIINNVPESPIAVNFEDMELYSIGEINNDNGEIDSKVQFLVNGLNVKKEV